MLMRLRQRRADAHLGERHALALGGRLLELAAVSAKRSIRPLMRSCGPVCGMSLHDVRDVDDVVALEHAEAEIVEVKDFHCGLPWWRRASIAPRARDAARMVRASARSDR